MDRYFNQATERCSLIELLDDLGQVASDAQDVKSRTLAGGADLLELHIVGAGSLGRLIVDLVESDDRFKIAGFFDDGYPGLKDVCGHAVVGKLADIDIHSAQNLAIGVGDPRFRKLFFEERSALGFNFPRLAHKSVILSKRCAIEEGVIIGPNSSVLDGSAIRKGACILSHVNINQDVVIDPYCLVGAGVVVGNNARIGEGCHIGLAARIRSNQIIEPWTTRNAFPE